MKPLRADAARRRARIIETASMLFVTQGERVRLEQVAAEANVGIATLYRNFPTRKDLVEAVVVHLCDEVVALETEAMQLLADGHSVPADILLGLVERVIPVGINVLVPALLEPGEEKLSPLLLEKKQELDAANSAIIAAARANGFIHESVEDEWIISGLIQLYQPTSFNIFGDPGTQYDPRPLIAVFLEGCERGVLGSIWYGQNA